MPPERVDISIDTRDEEVNVADEVVMLVCEVLIVAVIEVVTNGLVLCITAVLIRSEENTWLVVEVGL